MRADDKLHQRAEAPDGRCPKNMQTWYGRFEPFAKPRVSLLTANRTCQSGGEETVFCDIDAVPSSQKNVIDGSLAPVIEFHPYLVRKCGSRNNGASQFHRHALKPRDQPTSARRPYRPLPEPVLNRAWKAPNQVRPGHNLADACRTNVCRRVEKRRELRA